MSGQVLSEVYLLVSLFEKPTHNAFMGIFLFLQSYLPATW